MLCTYHFIQVVDVSSDAIFRLMSEDFQADTADFKAFFRSRQADLEACAVRLADGRCYFWSRYNDRSKDNGWEDVGTSTPAQFTMAQTKALLASTIPADYVHFDLELATEYQLKNWKAVSWTAKK